MISVQPFDGVYQSLSYLSNYFDYLDNWIETIIFWIAQKNKFVLHSQINLYFLRHENRVKFNIMQDFWNFNEQILNTWMMQNARIWFDRSSNFSRLHKHICWFQIQCTQKKHDVSNFDVFVSRGLSDPEIWWKKFVTKSKLWDSPFIKIEMKLFRLF